jgi:hypothetical protein
LFDPRFRYSIINMTNKELKLKLKNLQAARPAVLPNALWIAATRKMLVAKAKADVAAPVQGQLIAPVVLPRTALGRFMFVLRPVVATFMVAGLAVLGWAVGVSSSLTSKPGDLLYGLQNAAEQTQLTFDADPAARAYLNLELAARHANDVATIAEGNDVNRESDMLNAMGQLQNEIVNVKQNLNEVSASDSSADTAAVAKAVDRKVAEINAVFGETKNLLGANVQKKADAVQAAADDVSIQAVAVLVADAKTPADKSDAATRVQQTIDNTEAIIEVTSTAAADQAEEALKQAQAALASDNLAQAVVKVQESADLTSAAATTASTDADANTNINANTNTNLNAPAADTDANINANDNANANTNTNTNTDPNAGEIKAIGF